MGGTELTVRLGERCPNLLVLHLDDRSRPESTAGLPDNVPNLPKPFSVDTFLDRVRRLLAGRVAG
jgi:hypothetical protein